MLNHYAETGGTPLLKNKVSFPYDKMDEKNVYPYNLAKAGKKDEKNNPSYLFA